MESLLENVYISKLEEIDSKIESTLADVAKFLKGLAEERAGSADQVTKNEQDMIAFLKIITDFFREHQDKGFEELLLPHLSEIRLQNCFVLLDDSHSNIHEDESENTLMGLWCQLVKIVQKYIEDKLICMDVSPLIAQSDGRRVIWLRYLQILKGIISPEKLWDFHMKKRFDYLQRISCSCFLEEKDGIICLQCLFATCYELFIEDAEFIGLECFMNLVLTWNDLYSFYNNVLSTAVTVSLKNIDLNQGTAEATSTPQYFKCFLNKYDCKQDFVNYKEVRQFPLNLKRNETSNGETKNMETIIVSLIELVHTFESKIMKLMTADTVNIKTSCSKILIQLPNDSPDQSPIHKNAINNEYPWLWDWRLLFANEGLVTFLQRNLQNNISSCITTNCTKELIHFKHSKLLKTETVSCEKTNQKYRILPSVSIVIKEFNSFLPVLSASQGNLTPFCASFSHVIHTYLVEHIAHLKSLTEKNVPSSNYMDCLYTLYSSYFVLKEALQKYMHVTSNKKSNQLTGLVASINKTITIEMKSIELAILTWHRKVLLSGILHDSQSHNWKDNKAFLEGDNMSYSLRMWNLFLKSMVHEMTLKLPMSMAVELCYTVLDDSLQLLVTRYARAEASEAGTVQIRTEITFVLLCVMEFMPLFSASCDEFLGSQKTVQIEHPRCYNIHSYCSSLLIILSIKTSPIAALYKIFRMGFPYLQDSVQVNKLVASWLPWLHPALLPQSRDGSVISSVSVWLAVKFCISKMVCEPLSLIHALTMHTCTLSILMATESCNLPTDRKESQRKLLHSLLLIATQCRHQPTYTADILIPVIENCDGWKSFDGHVPITSDMNSKVWWFQALASFLKPSLYTILCTVVSPVLTRADVLNSQFFVEWKTMYLHLRKVIRCTCSNASTMEKNAMLSTCVLEIFQEVANNLAIFPLPIQMCMLNLQNFLTRSRNRVRPVGGCVALQIITDVIYNTLKCPSKLTKVFGFSPSTTMVKLCSEVADYFLGLIASKIKFEQVEITPNCQDKAQSLILQINNFFTNCNPKTVSEKPSDDELYLPLIFSSLQQHDEGRESLQYLYSVLRLNSKWIQKSLGITYALSLESMVNSLSPPSPLPNIFTQSETDEKKLEDAENLWVGEDNTTTVATCEVEVHSDNLNNYTFTLDVQEEIENLTFNPLLEVTKIGDDLYTYKQLLDFKFFWEPLLSHLPLLGLSEEGLKTLILHRWDMNNEDLLSEADVKYIQALKSIFNLEKIANK